MEKQPQRMAADTLQCRCHASGSHAFAATGTKSDIRQRDKYHPDNGAGVCNGVRVRVSGGSDVPTGSTGWFVDYHDRHCGVQVTIKDQLTESYLMVTTKYMLADLH